MESSFTTALITNFIVNLAIGVLAGFGCAAVPYFLSRYLKRPEMGISRISIIIGVTTLLGFFGMWQSAVAWGVLLAIVFSLGIAFSKPKANTD